MPKLLLFGLSSRSLLLWCDNRRQLGQEQFDFMLETRNVNDIEIGPRYRKDLGDLEPLKASLNQVGLLHPIVISPQGILIAGHRRLEAAKQLGWQRISVNIVNLENIVLGERDENAVRKDFTPSEYVAISKALEPVESKAAREREAVRSENFSDVKESDKGRALDKVASAVGVSRPTLTKAREVVEAAEREPEKFDFLVEQMDDTGKVDKAYREYRRMIAREEVKAREFPQGKFVIVYADPPWKYDFAESENREIENQYPTMELADICNLPVTGIAADDCVLLLWATNPKLTEALMVVHAWGFTYKTNMAWVKDKIGMGYYARQKHELLLIATRGNPITPAPSDRPESVICAPRTVHSAKPEMFYNVIERMYPNLPKVELFSRTAREGWVVWGNQLQ